MLTSWALITNQHSASPCGLPTQHVQQNPIRKIAKKGQYDHPHEEDDTVHSYAHDQVPCLTILPL